LSSPSLAELPPPPSNKTGWPWTLDSVRLPVRDDVGRPWPRITIVTPSFNQGEFIEETIRSVLLQGYPNLEYFVLDGGSTDNSVAVIEKYSKWIDFWVTGPDGGQSAAINRGLHRGTGAYATWINSDDLLCRNALSQHFATRALPAGDTFYVGDCEVIDREGRLLFTQRGRVHCLEDLVRIRSVWKSGGYISQPAVLFPRQFAMQVGGLNVENYYSMDYELWGKFFLAGGKASYTGVPFGCFRHHDAQKTADLVKQTVSTLDVATALLAQASWIAPSRKQEFVDDLKKYGREHPHILWKSSGRLARLGLPPLLVTPVRRFKRMVAQRVLTLLHSRN
jgi:hypothetical protein